MCSTEFITQGGDPTGTGEGRETLCGCMMFVCMVCVCVYIGGESIYGHTFKVSKLYSQIYVNLSLSLILSLILLG